MKKLCSIILFVLVCTFSYAQTWLWAKSAIGVTGSADGGVSVSADAGGNVFVTGYFTSPTITFGTTTLTNTGSYNIFIAKYDPNGNVLWAKSAGGTSEDVGSSVSADAGGNVFVSGDFESPTITFGTTTLTNAGSSDIFIAKYDASGNVLWAKSAGGTFIDVARSVSADAGGNVFVTGWFWTTITFGTTTLTNAGYPDVFLAKYDPNGNVLWAKSAGGTSDDESISVSADPIGNVFITGFFQSSTIMFGTITFFSSGNTQTFFLAKYDPSGNILWAKSAGGTYLDDGLSVSTDVCDNIYVTGLFTGPTITFGSTTLTNASVYGYEDVFIVKYDQSGNVRWAKSAGGSGRDIGFSCSTDASGNLFVAGAFGYHSQLDTITFGSTTLIPPLGSTNSTNPMFIVKYDANGNVLCASALSSGGEDQNAVTTDALGDVYVGGSFEINPFTVSSTTLTLTGTEDVFVAKYTCGGSTLTATVSQTNSSCGGTCAGTATVTPAGGTSPYTYLWNTSPAQTTQIATGLCAGNYTVTVNDASCSGGSTTATVSITAPTSGPSAGVSANITIISGSSTTLTATGGGTYSWSNGTTDAIISVSPTATTVYCVTAADTNNCTDTACVTVTLVPDCSEAATGKLYLPDAFSPNGDGENDFLKIYFGNMECINTFMLAIYDRWGEKIFGTTDPGFQWDGTYKGQRLNSDIFVYYMTAVLTNGHKTFRKGNISIVR